MSYSELWRRSVGNYLLGALVSVVPAFAFYSLAFDYTPEQLGVLLWLAAPGLGVMMAVDLLVLAAVLRPVRVTLEPAASGALGRICESSGSIQENRLGRHQHRANRRSPHGLDQNGERTGSLRRTKSHL